MNNTENLQPLFITRKLDILWVVGSFIVLVPLIAYAVNGSYMRYSGDDYCYAGVLVKFGFLKAQWLSYTQISTYNGNRFGLTLFSNLGDLFGPLDNAAYPGLAIVLWLAAIFVSLKEIAKFTGINLSRSATLLISELIVFFVFYGAPDISQSLYWRTGMLTYLAPLVATTFLISLLLHLMQKERLAAWALIATALLAFIGGGFSEVGVLLQVGYLGIALVAFLIALRRKLPWAMNGLKLCGAALAGSLIAMGLLAFSPTNQARWANLPPHPGLIKLINMSVVSAYVFTRISLRRLFLLNIAVLAAFFLIAYLTHPDQTGKNASSPGKFLLRAAVIGLIEVFLVVCTCAPNAYAQSSYPEQRALITSTTVMILALATVGWLAGWEVRNLTSQITIPNSYFLAAAMIVLAGLLIYPLQSTRSIVAITPKSQKWAAFWDIRDQKIRAASRNNVPNVEVMQLDHIIPRVGELAPDPGYWYNQCASMYYQVQTIKANQPGWDQ
jgi:hypothetical protein